MAQAINVVRRIVDHREFDYSLHSISVSYFRRVFRHELRPTGNGSTAVAMKEFVMDKAHRSVFTHFCYGIGGAAFGSLIAIIARPQGSVQTISLATAYAALCFLFWALLIGPLRVLRGGRPLISSRKRRHIGIWAGIFTSLHVAAGLNVHLGGNILQYFFTAPDNFGRLLPRNDAFGITNDFGAVATVATIVLLGISNDVSLRKLGRQRWKNIQRITYPVFAIVMIHAAIYQLIERRGAFLMIASALSAIVVAGLQAQAFMARKASTDAMPRTRIR